MENINVIVAAENPFVHTGILESHAVQIFIQTIYEFQNKSTPLSQHTNKFTILNVPSNTLLAFYE